MLTQEDLKRLEAWLKACAGSADFQRFSHMAYCGVNVTHQDVERWTRSLYEFYNATKS